MVRDTLIDFFDDLSRARGTFLVHDDGFRSRSYSYAEIARGARDGIVAVGAAAKAVVVHEEIAARVREIAEKVNERCASHV